MVSYPVISKHRSSKLSGILLFIAMLLPGAPSYAIQLTDLLWKNRVLLLFAQDHQDQHLQQTQYRLQQNNCDIKDRDIVIGIITNQGPDTLNNQSISRKYAANLRKQFNILNEQFVVILLGKDGSEKFRVLHLPDMNEIFAIIDGMPMRQDEMQASVTDCGKPN